MSINIQGNWKIQFVEAEAENTQRFIVSSANSGNGTYYPTSTYPINVTGNYWSVSMQSSPDGTGATWQDSILRKEPTQIVGGEYVFLVIGDDFAGGAGPHGDLVLRFSQIIPPPPPPEVEPPATPPPVIPPVLPPPNPPPVDNPPPIPDPDPPPPPVLVPGRVFTKFTTDDVLPRQENKVTYGIFLDYTGSACGNLLTFFTCSSDTGSYKKTVYSAPCFTCSMTPQFDIAYGHDGGSGSNDLGGNDFYTPSNAVYGQYRSLLLDWPQQRFNIGNREIFHFYSINIKRDRMGDRMDEGNWELNLHHLSGSQFLTGNGNRNAHTGSNVKLGNQTILRLIDDSRLDFSTLSTTAKSTFYRDISSSLCTLSTGAGKVHCVVSGTLEGGIYSGSASSNNAPHVYGLFYPQSGIIILDAELLDLSASFLTVTGSDVAGDNAMKLFTAISGAALRTDDSGDYLGFQGRKLKYEYVEQYFVRVRNAEYNFTNNLTYQTGSTGDIITDFYNNPITYITQVGLYDENHELLATGKISSPIQKKYTEEALIEIILKYS